MNVNRNGEMVLSIAAFGMFFFNVSGAEPNIKLVYVKWPATDPYKRIKNYVIYNF